MAAKRKKRKGVGPPPASSPRREAIAAGTTKVKPTTGASREPAPASPKGVLVRAGLVAAIFYPYLIFFAGESPLTSAIVAVLAFALMVPLGLFFDRLRYNRQMRRYMEKRAGSARR